MPEDKKPKEEEIVGLVSDVEKPKKKSNYNEIAQDVIKILEKSPEKEQFLEFVDFMRSFLELSIAKFGNESVLNYLENVKFDYRLTRRLIHLGLLKKRGEK